MSGAKILHCKDGHNTDEWVAFAEVWNPFCDKLNHGVFDVRGWRKVQQGFVRLGGCQK